jgi:hypothetical protein
MAAHAQKDDKSESPPPRVFDGPSQNAPNVCLDPLLLKRSLCPDQNSPDVMLGYRSMFCTRIVLMDISQIQGIYYRSGLF